MANNDIICRPTLDTFIRFSIVLAAFLGFGIYFFYDAAIGYCKANAVYYSYHAFARLGDKATASYHSGSWETERRNSPLIENRTENGKLIAADNEHIYPLPANCEAARTCPPETYSLQAMAKSWNDCWLTYTARMKYPSRPADHPYDVTAIREQWYAGGVCMAISAILLFLMIRTARRVMALRGDTVTAAGKTFSITDITRLDLRQWGKGFKGIAYATVNGRKVRLDGMTYGGFDPKKGEPADVFMKTLLSRYRGEILEYEET